MSIEIIYKNKHKRLYLKNKVLINQIYDTCKSYTNKNIDIYILDTNKFKMIRISKQFYKIIINDRRSGSFYQNLYQMGNPSILSFLFNEQYGEIYCSISNILNNHNLNFKSINLDLLLYISHSISNIYCVDNYMYNLIMSCVRRYKL